MKKQRFIGSIESYRKLFEEIDDVIMIVDQKGMIEYVNRALRNRFGYTQKRFTGRPVTECRLFGKSLKKQDILKLIFQHRDFVSEIEESGRVEHFAWRTKVFSHEGQRKAMAVVRDMTDTIALQKKVEDNASNLEEIVHQRTQQLEREKQKAIELQHTKVTFLSRMSHELRTPLTAIRGYAEMLQDAALSSADRERYLAIIERNSRQLLQMIDETLQMIQMQQNKYQIREQIFVLKPFLHELVETYAILTKEKGLELLCDIPDDIPVKLYSDPHAIRQILTNLLGNAIKFTENGKIQLTIKQRSFPFKSSKKLYFIISDSGSGIPAEHQRRIFKSFEQYLDNQSVHSRGTGLGLPISKQLAKLLGGDVRLLSSTPQEGSSFVFSLPIRKFSSPSPRPKPRP